MRLAGALSVLFFATAPALADPTTYTFGVTQGSLSLQLRGGDSTVGEMGGTFAVTIYQSDGHIGESDSFILEDCYLQNTSQMVLSLLDLATANVAVGSARLLDFFPEGPVHIGTGGAAVADTDILLEATVIVTGPFSLTFETRASAGSFLPLDVAISTSAARSDVVAANLGLLFGYEVGITEFDMTVTLDFVFTMEGTAHAVPDPALGGVTAMGLGGAGAWLRRGRGQGHRKGETPPLHGR